MGGCLSKKGDDIDPLNDSRRAPVLNVDDGKQKGNGASGGGDAKAGK
eukprot:CAMPEP_0181110650 /NCGR_PEP_ID=MMETSP1071-20121207/18833_1 /TAXON_ID=35127 /ORGANISM="Thalassiosira sp., Strain NH16" /LENGTH=46 /DNA_ID= /DNA_START= /DNA_END= /DNA_ORIENTATION=